MGKLEKWKVLSVQDVSPSSWFPVFKHSVKMPSGRRIDDYYVSHLGDVAMVLPVTSEGDVVFVRQYKHGISEITIELPAGRIEDGQSPEEAARAELIQETGIVAGRLSEIGQFTPVPSKDPCTVYGFLAEQLNFRSHQTLDETEEIELLILSTEELARCLAQGLIRCSDTLAVLLLASIRYPDKIGPFSISSESVDCEDQSEL